MNFERKSIEKKIECCRRYNGRRSIQHTVLHLRQRDHKVRFFRFFEYLYCNKYEVIDRSGTKTRSCRHACPSTYTFCVAVAPHYWRVT